LDKAYRRAYRSLATRRGNERERWSLAPVFSRRDQSVRLLSPFGRLGVSLLIGGLVVACTSAGTPAPTAGPSVTGTASPTAAPKGELPKPELTTLRLGTSAGAEMSQFAIPQAISAKVFEKYGITATVVGFEGEAKASPALQAGQIDMLAGGAVGSISSQLADVPFVTIGVTATVLTDDLVCTSGIKTAADVKGKRLAISGFGGVSHGSALLLAKALNLSAPEVVFSVVGGQSARIAALKAGSIDCAVVDKNLAGDMTAAGLNIVASNWKPPAQPFVRAGVSVTKAFMQKNPNTVLVALAAILEAQNLIWTDTAGTATRFAAHIQTDVAKARPNVEDFLNVGNRSLMWKDEAFTNTQKVIALANPDIIDVDLKTAYDRSLIQKLIDNGFYDKINNPARTPGG
jgi:NitT/TauT family transport system substrate-binding protein